MIFRYTFTTMYTYMERQQRSDTKFFNDVQYFMTKTVQTEKKYDGERLSFGALVRDEIDYHYFAGFVADNKLIINVCTALVINHIHANRGIHLNDVDEKDLLHIDGGLFWPTFLGGCFVLTFIFCFGFLYEFTRRRSTDDSSADTVREDSSVYMKGILD